MHACERTDKCDSRSQNGAGKEPGALQDTNKEWWHVYLLAKAVLLCDKSMNSLPMYWDASSEIMQCNSWSLFKL